MSLFDFQDSTTTMPAMFLAASKVVATAAGEDKAATGRLLSSLIFKTYRAVA